MLRFLTTGLACVVLLGVPDSGVAAVKTRTISYTAGSVEAKGYLAWDDSISGPRPGVLVVHEWWGLNDYARNRADELARLGYVAFACDMYGEGKVTEHPSEAGEFASKVRANEPEWRNRAIAALNVLTKQPECDPSRVAAMGYCFGGSTALQLAYSGADIKAVVTFHAALPTPTPEQAKAVKATIVVCHGANDTFIPQDAIDRFCKGLDAANVDWEFISYGGAVHSFTVPGADKLGNPGLKYNKAADERSWARMRALFEEKFGAVKAGK
jgi:dienelactone hydrolase